ncbi:hypothetical protein GIB67_012020, partial [Kingdonia uniflora]
MRRIFLVTHSPTIPIPMPTSPFHKPNGGTMTINDFEDLYRDNSGCIFVNECLNYVEDSNDPEIRKMVQSLASENMFQLGHVPKPMNIHVNGQDESLEISCNFRHINFKCLLESIVPRSPHPQICNIVFLLLKENIFLKNYNFGDASRTCFVRTAYHIFWNINDNIGVLKNFKENIFPGKLSFESSTFLGMNTCISIFL